MSLQTHHVLCVLDEGPVWEARVVNLLRSLRWYAGGLRSAPFTAIAIGGTSAQFRRDIDQLGGRVELKTPPIEGHPFMNKTAALIADRSATLIVLDCDTVIVGDLSPIRTGDREIRVKPADACPFGSETWRELETHVGPLSLGSMRTTTTDQVVGCYPNSGVIVVGAAVRESLLDEWLARYRLAAAAAEALFPSKAFYAEQIALGSAIVASDACLSELSVAFNWPAHLEATRYGPSPAPRLIHYHGMCRRSQIEAPLAPLAVKRRLERLAAAASVDIADLRSGEDHSARAVRLRSARLRDRAAELAML